MSVPEELLSASQVTSTQPEQTPTSAATEAMIPTPPPVADPTTVLAAPVTQAPTTTRTTLHRKVQQPMETSTPSANRLVIPAKKKLNNHQSTETVTKPINDPDTENLEITYTETEFDTVEGFVDLSILKKEYFDPRFNFKVGQHSFDDGLEDPEGPPTPKQERAGRDEVAALLTLLTLDLPQPNLYLLHDQSFLGKYTDQSFLGKYTGQSFLGKYSGQSFMDPGSEGDKEDPGSVSVIDVNVYIVMASISVIDVNVYIVTASISVIDVNVYIVTAALYSGVDDLQAQRRPSGDCPVLQVTLAVRTTPTTYTLMTSRVAASSGLPRLEAIGTWEVGPGGPRGHLTEPLLPDPNTLYGNMGGRQLVVSANADWPFFGLKSLPGGGVQPDSGIDIQIMNTLGQFLNFTYRVVSPADGQWGGPLPDGSVSGLIGQVARRESHLAICELTITANRETVVDFTTTYYLETVTLVSRAPAEKSRAFAVFSTFTTEVWVCILASTVAVGPLVSVVGRVVALYTERPPHRQLPEYSFHVFRSLVSQGNLLRPSNWPHRLLFFCWYLFCFYIYALYSGTLTAVLASPTYEKPIDGLVDLPKAAAEGYTIGTTSDSSLEFIFKEATEGIYKQVWQLFNHKDRSKSFFRSPEQGFAKILVEKIVVVNAQLNSEVRAAQHGRESYHMARNTFYPQAYGIACNKGSPFLPKFNQMLRRITEAGLIMRWKEQEISKISGRSPSRRGLSSDRGPSAITMKHLQAAFFVLLLGLVVGLLMLGAEAALSMLWLPKTLHQEAHPSQAWFPHQW
ncbi:glutamate receptor ionotropic, delta-2-like [Procambarus clarkii]|uniref:glutamate receptor ionotropic, delta-2-like n=1 Tax=Procambarus clarkii TaxID=6728 RepID=UPI0037423749